MDLAPLLTDSTLVVLAVTGLIATLLAIAKDTRIRRRSPRPDIA